MKNTICLPVSDLLSIHTHEVERFLNSQGIKHNFSWEGEFFVIEMHKVPAVFDNLRRKNINVDWHISNASEAGITLYYTYMGEPAADGYLFLPMGNIISIHTVTPDWVDKAARSTHLPGITG